MNALAFSIVCALTFNEDLTSDKVVRGTLARFEKDNKVLHALNEMGFAFADSKQGMNVSLVAIDPITDFGLPFGASHNEVLKKGTELGLSKCPNGTPIQFMLDANPLPPASYIFAMDAVRPKTDKRSAHVLTVFCFEDGYQLLDSCIYDSADQPRRDNRMYLFRQE